MAIFASLIVLFLERSEAERPRDRLWHYLAVSIALAIADRIGNGRQHAGALIIVAGALLFIAVVLKPFSRRG